MFCCKSDTVCCRCFCFLFSASTVFFVCLCRFEVFAGEEAAVAVAVLEVVEAFVLVAAFALPVLLLGCALHCWIASAAGASCKCHCRLELVQLFAGCSRLLNANGCGVVRCS